MKLVRVIALLAISASVEGIRMQDSDPVGKNKLFDVYGTSDIRGVDSLAHRSALVIGLDFIQHLHIGGYDVLYVEENDEECQNIFRYGKSCILQNLTDDSLPFSTMSIDLIIIHKRYKKYLQDIQRLLTPLGTLIIQGESSTVPSLKFMRTTEKYINVYKRNFVPGDLSYGSLVLPKGYEPPSAGLRYQNIIKEDDISFARLKWWNVENVLNLDPQKELWTDTVNLTMHQWFLDNYVGETLKDQSREMVHKHDWPEEYETMIRDGKITSMVDAGAGSCSLALMLREKNLMKKLNYFAFGFYDESMARICAERGQVIMDWSWFNKLPVCSQCKYDLVFQVEGMHHIGQDCEKKTLQCVIPQWRQTMDNFDEVTKCGGFIHVGDNDCNKETDYFFDGDEKQCWAGFAVEWAKEKGYNAEASRTRKAKTKVLITKRCVEM